MKELNPKKICLVNFYILLSMPIIIFVFIFTIMPMMIPQQYIAVFDDGEVSVNNLSSIPLTTNEVIDTFVKEAILYSLSFRSDKLAENREAARPYYSPESFSVDFAAIEDNRINLINNQDVILSRVIIPDNLILLGTREFNGRKMWRFYANPRVQYEGQGGIDETSLNVIVIVSQTNSGRNIRGIQVDNITIR